jgi:hypothetical protein
MEKRGAAQALEAADVTRTMPIGWSDEFRIGLYGSTHKVLAPRGIKIVQPVELTRDWYHLAVIVDPRTGTLVWSWVAGTAGTDLAPAVQEWREAGFAAVVWDGLTAHHAPAVRTVGVALIEQPPVSPELNPAERIGEEIRAHTDGKVYGTIWKKMAAVEAYLRELAADPERVKRLVGWEWIIQAIKKLPWKRKGSH